MRRGLLAAAVAALAVVWLGPLEGLLPHFTAHMTRHIVVVAVAAPLIALGIAGTRVDPAVRHPAARAAVVASLVELVVIWIWHAPTAHDFARESTLGGALEQASFLIAALWLWVAALGGDAAQRRARATGSVTALLLTAMHMTLLGALLVIAPRPLYPHPRLCGALDPLTDQHIGGAIMLLGGGAAYLAAGLGLTADVLGSGRRRAA